MTFEAARQASLFIARKNRRSRALIGALQPWAAGMVVTEGMVVQSFDAAWRAELSGTAGTIAPAISEATVFDGNIYWTRVFRLLTSVN